MPRAGPYDAQTPGSETLDFRLRSTYHLATYGIWRFDTSSRSFSIAWLLCRVANSFAANGAELHTIQSSPHLAMLRSPFSARRYVPKMAPSTKSVTTRRRCPRTTGKRALARWPHCRAQAASRRPRHPRRQPRRCASSPSTSRVECSDLVRSWCPQCSAGCPLIQPSIPATRVSILI